MNLIKKLIKWLCKYNWWWFIRQYKRIIPDGLCADIDLNKIKTLKIFKWLKNFNISDKEMLKTFNCGVGFCLIIKLKNLKKINKFFSKN